MWDSGLHLSDMISDNLLNIKDKNVLEFGAGAGLPSIIAAKSNLCRSVVSSDYDDHTLIDNLKMNVTLNNVHNQAEVIPHIWGTNVDALLRFVLFCFIFSNIQCLLKLNLEIIQMVSI